MQKYVDLDPSDVFERVQFSRTYTEVTYVFPDVLNCPLQVKELIFLAL